MGGRGGLEQENQRGERTEGGGGAPGGTAKTKGHFRGHMETCLCRSFLKYIHIYKKSKLEPPNNRGDKAPTRRLSPPNETSSARNVLQLNKLLAKRTKVEISKHSRLMPKLLVALYKLTVRLCCQRQHLTH